MKINLDKLKKSRTTEELLEFGIINIDKPSGPTSFNISDFVKKTLGLRKTSHFGTLDPNVTGVLPIALNRACKLTGYFIGHDKEYVGVMRIHDEVDEKEIKKVIKENFTGKISQLPPVRSRVKRAEREREIKRFDLLEKNGKDFVFIAEVQGGTYIRKLISDLGEKMNIGAHMLELRRIRAGIFSENNKEYPIVNLYDFEKAVEEYKNGNDKKLRSMIVPGEILSEIYPVIEVKKDSVKNLLTGKPLKKLDSLDKIDSDKFLAFYKDKFIGIYRKTNETESIGRPEFVLQDIK